MANTGNIIVTERDINPFSPTYNTTRTRTYEDLTRCPLPANFKLHWSDTGGGSGEVACNSSSTLSYNEGPINNKTYINSVHVGDCVTTIDGAFNGYTALASVTLSNSVTTIGNLSFQRCSALDGSGITIPSSVTTIGSGAFGYCTGLTSITIPDSVASLGASAFTDCTYLANVTLSSGLTEIANYTFSECYRLRNIAVPYGVTRIGENAFEWCGLRTVNLPSTLTSIGKQAFYHNRSLESITVEAVSPPSMGNEVFSNTNSTFIIYVPAESVNAYKSATGWSSYASRIQAIQS